MTPLNQSIVQPPEKVGVDIKCPRCHSVAKYKYGKTAAGSKRYICLICNRQFTQDSFRTEIKERPLCPSCGKTMHIYMRSDTFIRFRCSNYPKCKTFKKLPMEDV
jgi:transposase-like protein